jgi:hypothetical protein
MLIFNNKASQYHLKDISANIRIRLRSDRDVWNGTLKDISSHNLLVAIYPSSRFTFQISFQCFLCSIVY